MTVIPHLVLTGVLLIAAGWGAAWSDPPGGDPTPPPPPERVVLQVSRFETVRGVVAREDPDQIVIRTPTDEIKAFMKARLLRLTRLVRPAPGQSGVVHMADGSMREGIILEDEYDFVLMEIAGVRTRLDRALVDRVELRPPFEEQYRRLKETIPPTQFDRRLELCKWLIDQKRFALALEELEDLQRLNADLKELPGLIRVVRAQLALESGAGGTGDDATRPDSPGAAPSGPSGPVDQKDLLPTRLLTPEEVNIIRVFEVDFDRPPSLRIEAETIRKLITQYASHPSIPANSEARNALFRADPLSLLRIMFEVRARELYPEVKVLSEPYSLNLFRQRVHNTWLVPNCATSQCHGGVKAGRFFLHNRNYRDDRVRYTNLLILQRAELDPQKPLINWEEPLMSRIIQHALPTTEARDPHPPVPGWKPVFTKLNQPLLEDAVAWIRSMYQPRPDYPIDYTPPDIGRKDDAPFGAPGTPGNPRVPR
ncbi:MAG: hypothetical protein KJZ68_14060 [Phycisphaerales bacterium]|nr:hypothetical protein [Phycisphaerales bacterium]